MKFRYELRNGKKLIMEAPFQHDPYHKHFRISPRQARKISPEDIPQGWELHVIETKDYKPGVCPHCQKQY